MFGFLNGFQYDEFIISLGFESSDEKIWAPAHFHFKHHKPDFILSLLTLSGNMVEEF